MKNAAHWIRALRLRPHPEGGFFRETYRAAESLPAKALPPRFAGARAVSTAIYYLLRDADFSAFHRIRSDEVWHFYAGRSLRLHVIGPDGRYAAVLLGSGSTRGAEPQAVVAAGAWFAAELARPPGFALAGCTVAPGFDFADLELADPATLAALCPSRRALIRRLTRRD